MVLPKGYYDEFVVSTDITTEGEVYYHHHVHSELSVEEFVENQSPIVTTDGPADTEQVSESSGCFTKPVYGTKACGNRGWKNAWSFDNGFTSFTTATCTKCGATRTGEGNWEWGNPPCNNQVTDTSKILGYTTGCGITRGTVTEAIIKYNKPNP